MATKRAAPVRRPRHAMPADVASAIKRRKLTAAYRARPPYQRNDYIGWIERSVRADTRKKRIQQMLSELAAGEGYMKMAWRPRRAKKAAATKRRPVQSATRRKRAP